MSYFNSRTARRARQAHKCYHCSRPIAAGERYEDCAWVFEGDFQTSKSHFACSQAWEAFNWGPASPRDLMAGEGAGPLWADDLSHDDRPWFEDEFPSVAERLWGGLTLAAPVVWC